MLLGKLPRESPNAPGDFRAVSRPHRWQHSLGLEAEVPQATWHQLSNGGPSILELQATRAVGTSKGHPAPLSSPTSSS